MKKKLKKVFGELFDIKMLGVWAAIFFSSMVAALITILSHADKMFTVLSLIVTALAVTGAMITTIRDSGK